MIVALQMNKLKEGCKLVAERIRGLSLWQGLGLLLVFGILIRLGYCFLFPQISRDGIDYLNQMLAWHDIPQSGFVPDRVSGVPLYGWIGQNLIGTGVNPEWIGIGISIVAWSLSLIPFCFLAWKFFGRSCSLWVCCLLWTVHPTVVELSCQIQREMLYLFFAISAFALVIRSVDQKSIWLAALAGSTWTLACYSRFEALELGILLPFVFLVIGWHKWMSAIRFGGALTLFFVSSIIVSLLLDLWMGFSQPSLTVYAGRIMKEAAKIF